MKKILVIILLLFLHSIVIFSQTPPPPSKIKEDKPYSLYTGEPPTEVRGSFSKSTIDLKKYTIRNIQISLGPNGTIQGLSSDSILNKELIQEFNFPTLYFSVSAAAKLITDDVAESTGRIVGNVKTLTELRQMWLNIILTPLDENYEPIINVKKSYIPEFSKTSLFVQELGKEPLLTLGIAPFESFFSSGPSLASKFGEAISSGSDSISSMQNSPSGNLGSLACIINPLGAVAKGISAVFRIFCPTKNLPTQVSYISSASEFGWIWREAENVGIEGIHSCAALLRTHKSVKNVLVQAELVTDWKKLGAWMKEVDYYIPVIVDK